MAVAALGTIPSIFQKTDRAYQVVTPSPVPSTVFVPGGRFAVGAAWVEGRPVREAEVRPLRFSLTPVSNAAYAGFLAAFGAAEPPWWRDPEFSDPEQPVVGITWIEAVEYCGWLHDTLGGRWRLPSEAEWEHAAAPAAADPDARPAAQRPTPLGRGTANGYGLLDMGSSVHEWCNDWFTPEPLQLARRYDPRGPETGECRVRRGGSWRSRARTASWRDGFDPSARAADGGFRVVREVP